MKSLHNWWLIVVTLILLVITFGLYFTTQSKTDLNSGSLWDDYRVIEYELEGKEMDLIVSDTPERHAKGLMHVREPIPGVDGMIFVFPTSSPRSFWNMNTFMDLDLYWIEDKKVIGKSKLPSILRSKNVVSIQSPGPADTVIEIY